MTHGEDYYAILRVSGQASSAELREAYRSLMRRYHPDVNASAEAMSTAKAINEAYACLRDVSRRAAYDRRRKAHAQEQRSARASRPTHSPQPQRPVWTGPRDEGVDPTLSFQPRWWKAVGLGGATLLTIITFTLTSATPPPDPHISKPGKASVRILPSLQRMNVGAAHCDRLVTSKSITVDRRC